MNNSVIRVNVVEESLSKRIVEIAYLMVKRNMGEYHAHYAKAALESGLTRLLTIQLNKNIVGLEIFYTINLGLNILVHYYVVVEEEYRGKHLAKILILSAEELAKNVEAYVATTTIDNLPARKLFSNLGYSEFTWDTLEKHIGTRNTYKLIQATCAHEDDVVFIKPAKNSTKKLLEKIRSLKLKTPWKLWKKICYKPWLTFLTY